MVKPYKSLLLLVYLGVFLGVLELLPNQLEVGTNFQLKIPKISAIFNTKKIEYADISKITKDFDKDQQKNSDDSTKIKKVKNKVYVPDSLRLNPELRIQFPENEEDALAGFFKALEDLSRQDTIVRAVHFGDSQLEGDRITAFLRNRFQQTFGGCGVGVLNVVDKLNSKLSIAQNTKFNWLQSVAYGPKFSRRNPNYYGILGDYYKMPLGNEAKWTKATFTYFKSPYATPKQQEVQIAKVLYRNPEGPFELSLQLAGQAEYKTKIEESKDFNVFYYPIEGNFENITIGTASGSKSPEIYGVALDCKKGVTFDNVPLRGSSGVDFTNFNREHLKNQLEKLNVRFLILQFGVNLVPNPQSDYSWYENLFYEQLKYLKSLRPNLSILVVGVSDMSRNMTGDYESYPNIEKIRDAQKRAAFRAKCAFWDLYEAMGGKNSMPSWVFAKPVALANKDFTHFTAKGAEIVSEMLYKALMNEYYEFKQLHN
jgi:lysophospholipase L1-like esterase